MKKYILSVVLSLFMIVSYGQKINTTASVGANLFGGNWDSYLVNSQFVISKDSSKVTWSIASNFTFGQVRKDDGWHTNQQEAYLIVNSTHKWNRNRVIAFGESESSYLKKIQFRGAFGCGYGYDIVRNNKFTLLITESYLLERYISEDNTKNLTTGRLSTRIKLEYRGKIKITSITLFQPAIASSPSVPFANNINLRTNTSIDFPVSKKLSIGLQLNGYLSTYSTYINNEVKPFDYSTLLTFKFKNF